MSIVPHILFVIWNYNIVSGMIDEWVSNES